MRAMLSLPLLVPGVRADDPHHPAPPYDLATLANRFYARSHFHLCSLPISLGPEPVSDPSPAQVVGAELHLHPVARQYPDVVHPHLARDVRQHIVPALELDPELRVGQRLGDRAFNLYDVFFGQGPPTSNGYKVALKPNEYVITSALSLTPREHRFYPPCSSSRVSTHGPFSVTARVCSKWAEREPSAV